jgi:acetyl-CoA C-acetyltransferase
MTNTDPIVITSYARTPIGNLMGVLKSVTATQLGSHVIRALIQRANIAATHIDEVFMGCVLPAGLGQAPARQAALNAGLSEHTTCTTINKVCGSGMKAIMLAHDSLMLRSSTAVIAGGMESMTNAPYLLKKARGGYRLGHGELFDHLMLDGLQDAYEPGRSMGSFAEDCARELNISRESQDAFALRSFERARAANENGGFQREMVPLTITEKNEKISIQHDERPENVNFKNIPQLKPAFANPGTVTAGNASSIADGAAGVMLMRLSQAKTLGLTPVAKICGHASFAKKPAEFTTAPIDATQRLLKQLQWSTNDVDLFEVNEAFAVVAIAFMQALNVSPEKVNIHGGACALGHPIGASGARILVTLLGALQSQGKKRGVATLCIGGGEATAIAVECL